MQDKVIRLSIHPFNLLVKDTVKHASKLICFNKLLQAVICVIVLIFFKLNANIAKC